jgi:hypothetical protein
MRKNTGVSSAITRDQIPFSFIPGFAKRQGEARRRLRGECEKKDACKDVVERQGRAKKGTGQRLAGMPESVHAAVETRISLLKNAMSG